MSEGSDLIIVCRWLCGPEMCGGNNSGVAALFFDTHCVKLARQFQFARGIWNNIVSRSMQRNIGFVGFITVLEHTDGWRRVQAESKKIVFL